MLSGFWGFSRRCGAPVGKLLLDGADLLLVVLLFARLTRVLGMSESEKSDVFNC